jgi:predicted enzyme related to lactoylglutathione lyase
MTSQLFAICFNATRPSGVARFWSGVLGWELADGPDDDVAILPPDTAGFRIRFLPSQEPKIGQNRAHFDLTSTSPEDQQQTVVRALEFGGKHIDVGQLPEEGHVVLADPDGNEFCVIEAGNKFLADTGFIGALACDGTQEVGRLLLEPGAAVAAGLGPGPGDRDPIAERRYEDHVGWSSGGAEDGHEQAVLRAGAPRRRRLEAEVDRLISLGATRTDVGEGDGVRVLMLDPDGNEFSVQRPR